MSELDQFESDTRDEAESYVLLDDGEIRPAVCAQCGRMFCKCCPIHRTYGCPCDAEEPISQQDERRMRERFDGTRRWRS